MYEIVDAEDMRGPDEFPRLSQRYQIEGLELFWSPPAGGLVGGGRPKEVSARVIDLSIAGALLVAPTNKRIAKGMRIPLRIGDSVAKGDVRNVRMASTQGMSFYGIGFGQMSDGFTLNVNTVVGRLRKRSGPT